MDIDFQKVWNRVTAAQPETDNDRLLAFIADERRDAAEYSRLARCTSSPQAKRLFMKLAADEQEHMKRLLAAMYMRSGDNCPHTGETQTRHCERILPALRRRYTAEQSEAEAYAAAAASTRDSRLRSLYTELSKEEQRHGDALCELFKKLM